MTVSYRQVGQAAGRSETPFKLFPRVFRLPVPLSLQAGRNDERPWQRGGVAVEIHIKM